jgi:hypothetical protein
MESAIVRERCPDSAIDQALVTDPASVIGLESATDRASEIGPGSVTDQDWETVAIESATEPPRNGEMRSTIV